MNRIGLIFFISQGYSLICVNFHFIFTYSETIDVENSNPTDGNSQGTIGNIDFKEQKYVLCALHKIFPCFIYICI